MAFPQPLNALSQISPGAVHACGAYKNSARVHWISEECGCGVTQKAGQLYLEDLFTGQTFMSGTYVMEAAKIKEFASEFDPQPFHLDEDAAAASIFNGLVASGWHTAAVAMRLLATGGLPLAAGLVGLGGEIAWPRPTHPGDVVHLETEILEIRPSRSRPNQGIVTIRSTMLNQNGESVYVLTARLIVPRRQI